MRAQDEENVALILFLGGIFAILAALMFSGCAMAPGYNARYGVSYTDEKGRTIGLSYATGKEFVKPEK